MAPRTSARKAASVRRRAGRLRRPTAERLVLAGAARRHGLVVIREARRAGMSAAVVRRLVRRGAWRRVTPKVAAIAGAPDTANQRLLAAILDAGEGAAADGRSAARLWKVPGFTGEPIDITMPRRRHGHCSRPPFETDLDPDLVTTIDGIPVVSAARMLFGLARLVPEARLARAVDNALAMRLVTWTDLADLLGDFGRRGRDGTAAFRRVVDERCDDYEPPASELEAVIVDLIRRAGLPEPKRQVEIFDEDGLIGRFDLVWTAERVVVEADSKRHHMSLLDFERDRENDSRLTAEGWRPVRISWRQATVEADTTMRRLAKTLGVAAPW